MEATMRPPVTPHAPIPIVPWLSARRLPCKPAIRSGVQPCRIAPRATGAPQDCHRSTTCRRVIFRGSHLLALDLLRMRALIRRDGGLRGTLAAAP
jgi:hypothetical protein